MYHNYSDDLESLDTLLLPQVSTANVYLTQTLLFMHHKVTVSAL